MPNFWVGGDPSLFNDPNQGMTTAAISQLSSSNFGARAAQQAEASSGRAFQTQEDDVRNNPNFGRNAAVTSNLIDKAAQVQGDANSRAVTAGATVDANARVQGAKLSMAQSNQQMQENQLNYQRQQDASFGNSFFGHVLSDAVGVGVGALTGGLGAGLASSLTTGLENAGGNGLAGQSPLGYQAPSDAMKAIWAHDASFKKGEIKMIIGKDGQRYIPRSDDGVEVGTNLGSGANRLLEAGAIKPKFSVPMGMNLRDAMRAHQTHDFSAC